MSIGERIKFIRGGLTQKEFAKRINADQSTIQNWENKNKLPKGDILQRIHEEFNVNINWLLSGEGDPYVYGSAVYVGQEDSKGQEYGKPQPDNQKDGDPLVQTMSSIKEIFDSQDPFIIPALESDILAHLLYVRRDKKILEQAEEIRRLRNEDEVQKKRLSALEEKCDLLLEEIKGLLEVVRDRRKMTIHDSMNFVYKVNDAIAESVDIKGNLEKILDQLLELLHRVDRGAIILLDNELGEISQIISRSKKQTEDITNEFIRPIVELVKEGEAPLLIHNIEDIKGLSTAFELSKNASLMCVPLINDQSRIRGIFYIDSIDKPYGFRREDLILLIDLSKRAAMLIEQGMNQEQKLN